MPPEPSAPVATGDHPRSEATANSPAAAPRKLPLANACPHLQQADDPSARAAVVFTRGAADLLFCTKEDPKTGQCPVASNSCIYQDGQIILNGEAPKGSREVPFNVGEGVLKEKARLANAFEKKCLRALLVKHEGDVDEATKEAKIPRGTFYRLARNHGLVPRNFRPSGWVRGRRKSEEGLNTKEI